jgi:hypothetical protein
MYKLKPHPADFLDLDDELVYNLRNQKIITLKPTLHNSSENIIVYGNKTLKIK